MTTFIDGPAAGQNLALRRKVKFLRVVFDEQARKWDALDQPTDEPRAEETVYAYVMHEDLGMCHIRSSKPGGSGFFSIASYRMVKNQPPDDTLRNRAKWVEWCEGEPNLG